MSITAQVERNIRISFYIGPIIQFTYVPLIFIQYRCNIVSQYGITNLSVLLFSITTLKSILSYQTFSIGPLQFLLDYNNSSSISEVRKISSSLMDTMDFRLEYFANQDLTCKHIDTTTYHSFCIATFFVSLSFLYQYNMYDTVL